MKNNLLTSQHILNNPQSISGNDCDAAGIVYHELTINQPSMYPEIGAPDIGWSKFNMIPHAPKVPMPEDPTIPAYTAIID